MQSKAIAISQSRYIPWLGYMDRIAKVDLFVILDCVQLDHRCYEKRTKIKTNNGEQWLTIPVLKTARNSPMHEAEVSESTDWGRHFAGLMGDRLTGVNIREKYLSFISDRVISKN